MIIKHEGEKVNVNPWEYSAISLYQIYQTIATSYYREKTKHWYDTWGFFGFGTTTVGLFVTLVIYLFSPIGSDLLLGVIYYGYIVFFLYATYRRIQGPVSMKNPKRLPKFSESGYPLSLIPYRADTNNSAQERAIIAEKYYDIHCSATTEYFESPLKKPVIVDTYEVVGAYAEVELTESFHEDIERMSQELENTKYWLVLHGGMELRVDAEYFRNVVLNLQKTADGEEYWVPVLSGLKMSVILGAIVDMTDACVHSLKTRGLSTEHYLQEFGKTLSICETTLSLVEKDHPIHQRL